MPLAHADELPRVLTVLHAQRHGVSRSTLRTQVAHGSWRSMAAGVVLTRPDSPTRYDWAAAGVLLAGPTSALSGWEALQLEGVVRGTPTWTLPVLVLTREHRSRNVGPVMIRRTDRPFRSALTPWEADLSLAPVVSVARAVADAAIALPTLDSVRAVVAAAIQRERCNVDDLVEELQTGPQRNSAFLRTALAEVAAGARSVAESHALVGLRRGRVPPFELNVPIHDGSGRLVFTVDVLWRALRAALEIDSAEYHFNRGDWARTLDRHAALTAAGLSVLHLPPSRITPDGAWVPQVARWLDARAAELGLVHPGVVGGVLSNEPDPLVLPTLRRTRAS